MFITFHSYRRFHGVLKTLTFISSSNSGSVGSTISEKLKFGKGESKTPSKGIPFSSVKNGGDSHIRFGSNQVSSSYPAEYQKQIRKKGQNNNGFTYMIHLSFDVVQRSYMRIALPRKFITARNSSCDKVMFLHVSVILSPEGGQAGRHPPAFRQLTGIHINV